MIKDLEILFDLSKITSAHSLFANAEKITRLPEINLVLCGAASSSIFTNCKALVTIDKLIVAANNASMSGWFSSCAALQNMTIVGTIGTTGLNLRWSTKLSKASITSVITALSATTSGLTVTLSNAAVNNAYETSEGAADGSVSAEWAELIATKTNWTITLA